MKRIWNKVLLFPLFVFCLGGCNKFLEEKSDKSLGIPVTIADYRALLNGFGNVNSNYLSMGEASSGDFSLTDADYNGLYYDSDKRLYSWQPDYVTREVSGAGHEWYYCYKGIYVSNSILKGLDDNGLTGKDADEVRGQALVFRAARYLDGVQAWAPVYDVKRASKDLGMALRLDPDMNLPSKRATVQQTYDLILSDLQVALPLLPIAESSPALPTKAAAYGLLARAYLIKGDYEKALFNGQEALKLHNDLIDFNDLSASASFPIPATNQTSREVVFFTRMYASNIVNLNIAQINKDLYLMYAAGDLRKSIYFRLDNKGAVFFKGTHMGHQGLITGITSSELLLIVAECQARLGDIDKAAETLNLLMINRWDKNTFTPFVFTNVDIALRTILNERRKELLFRGLRWSDVKRLNRDGAGIILSRRINNQEFILTPNDKRYAIALPEDVLDMTGMEQNPR
ncbi:RagB/SusD family nutrient uptake outer membrane protein [Sphingobacterium prati]|uniref:RagB/SusD family nutrient uptake outer membrane protein n=1 Tax=Sphingobacterium prati TaxID=2737006 RepID=UPI0015552504|nr:RagB/SusD family nutrient uptake outer membrane protein [Sphingobacterium prati]NPE49171.1 RagB/SusD family nutrient uptake outer membrane protein [Sphingobacterium prati]